MRPNSAPCTSVENERRPRILVRMFDLHSVHLQPANVSNKKSMRGSRSKHVGLGIVFLFFGKLAHGVVVSSSALMEDRDITQLHVFDGMPRNPRKNRADGRRAAL